MTSQLERDLRNRCKERTYKLACDLFDLFDMAGLDDTVAVENILTAFFMETAGLAAACNVDPEEAAIQMGKLVMAFQQNQEHYKKKHGHT